MDTGPTLLGYKTMKGYTLGCVIERGDRPYQNCSSPQFGSVLGWKQIWLLYLVIEGKEKMYLVIEGKDEPPLDEDHTIRTSALFIHCSACYLKSEEEKKQSMEPNSDDPDIEVSS